MRQQRKDVSPKYKEAQRWPRCYFSSVSRRRIEREKYSSFRGALHNFSHIMLLKTYGIDHSYEARVKCKIVYDGGLITWISAKPTDWTPEVNYHISWKMTENSVLCGELRAPRCPGFYRLVLPALPHLSLRHRVIAGLWKFYYVSSNNTSTRRPVTNPVTGRRTSTGKPVTAWIVMRKGLTGKEFTLTSWKTEIAKCRRARTTWTPCKRPTSEAIPRAAKFGRVDDSRAHSLNWDLWIWKQSPIRYRGANFGSLKDPRWNETSQGRHGIIPWNLALICEVDHGIEQSKSTPHRAKRFDFAE